MGFFIALVFRGLSVPHQGAVSFFHHWEHKFCSLSLYLPFFFHLAKDILEFYPPESSALLLSCAGSGCHGADTSTAPLGWTK